MALRFRPNFGRDFPRGREALDTAKHQRAMDAGAAMAAARAVDTAVRPTVDPRLTSVATMQAGPVNRYISPTALRTELVIDPSTIAAGTLAAQTAAAQSTVNRTAAVAAGTKTAIPFSPSPGSTAGGGGGGGGKSSGGGGGGGGSSAGGGGAASSGSSGGGLALLAGGAFLLYKIFG